MLQDMWAEEQIYGLTNVLTLLDLFRTCQEVADQGQQLIKWIVLSEQKSTSQCWVRDKNILFTDESHILL